MLYKFHSNRDLIFLQGSLGIWNRVDTPDSLTNDDEDDSSLNYMLKKTKNALEGEHRTTYTSLLIYLIQVATYKYLYNITPNKEICIFSETLTSNA